ncbi:ELF4 1 [Spatholobus suberectus]|nr:ELF4 1 [Spatholobus suberectus]
MDETAVTTKPDWFNNHAKVAGERTEDVGGDDDDKECDGDDEAWDMLSRTFRQAQIVLDENRGLIEEVNSNHESKIPDKMVKNVGLITQIHGNISKVRSIYSDLSVNFSNIVHQRRVAAVNHRNRDCEEDEDKAENSEDDSAEHVLEKSEMIELMAAGMHRTLSAHRYEGGPVDLGSREGKGNRTKIEPVHCVHHGSSRVYWLIKLI